MKKILFITPHLSTGGLPQFLLKKIELLYTDNYEINTFEWTNYSNEYTVQKKAIQAICPLYSGENKTNEEKAIALREVITSFRPDVIHFEELPETFVNNLTITEHIFNRTIPGADFIYSVICSTHGSNKVQIKYIPDLFLWPSSHCLTMYNHPNVKVWEYPIDDNRNEHIDTGIRVLQVGLWSPHKNQGYSIQIVDKACEISKLPIELHFIGNNAENFRGYWQDLIHRRYDNYIEVHGEQDQEYINKQYKRASVLLMPSTMELNPIAPKEALGFGVPVLINNLPNLPSWYRKCEGIGFLTGDVYKDAQLLLDTIKLNDHNFDLPRINNVNLSDIYANINPVGQKIPAPYAKPEFVITYLDQPKMFINNGKGVYEVRFIDGDTGTIVHHTLIDTSTQDSTTLNRNYYTNWLVEVRQNGNIVFESKLSLEGKEVFITIESSSLGDTLAWVPYIDLFQQMHECKLRVSTFWNGLFKDQYSNIVFVDPKESQHGLYAHYKMGVFNKDNRNLHPNHPFIIPLQRVASDRLGIPYIGEIKPRIARLNPSLEKKSPYVVICTESTAGAKEWQNPGGWQKTVYALTDMGYEVRVIQKRPTDLKGITDRTGDLSIHNRIKEIADAEFFIGLPSGLSWLAWALDTPVYMISGFSIPYTEFESNRIQNFRVCNGCWNNPAHTFNKGDWFWCPEHKNTERQFECTRSITPEMVIKKIKELK